MKKILSVLLSVLMVTTLATTNVFAAPANIGVITISGVNDSLGDELSDLTDEDLSVTKDIEAGNIKIDSISYNNTGKIAVGNYEVTIVVSTNKAFKNGAAAADKVTATVNGHNADSITVSGGNKTATIKYKFTITKPHIHWETVEYSATGNTITAKCGDNCSDKLSESISITNPSDGTYSGTAFEATVTGDKTSDRLKAYGVQYFKGANKLDGAPSNAGKYKSKLHLKVGDKDYLAEATGEFTISKAKITITPDNKSISYGDDATYTGTINPTGLLKTDPTYVSKYVKNDPQKGKVGTYEITAKDAAIKDADKDNYELDYEKGTLTVSKATNSCTTDPTMNGWTYGSTASSPTGAQFAFGTDTVKYKYSSDNKVTWGNTKPTKAGTYYVKAVVTGNENYSDAESNPVEFTIAKKEVTVSGIEATARDYDGTTDAPSLDYKNVVFNGIVEKDKLTVTATASAFADKNAGTNKKVNISNLQLGGDDVANYELAATGNQTTVSATINKKKVTVSVTSIEKVYDATTTAADTATDIQFKGSTVTGAINGESLTAKGSGTFSAANKGENLTVSNISYTLVADANTSVDNYEVEYGPGKTKTTENTGKITAYGLTVTGLAAEDKDYDETDTATLDWTNAKLNTKIGTDDVELDKVGSSAKFAQSTVGTDIVVTPTVLLKGTAKDNYTITSINGGTPITADINVKEVTIKDIKAKDKTYDGTSDAELEVTDSTKIYDEDNNEITSITVSVADGGKGTFVRNDGTTPSKSAASSQKKVAIAPEALELSNTNYSITSVESTYAKISKASVTLVGLTAESKEYDGTDSANVNTDSYHIEGAIGSDEVEVDRIVDNAFKFEKGKNVGENKLIVLASEDVIKLSGEDASNYIAEVKDLKADITAKKIIVNGIEANDKEYDGTTSATLKVDKKNHIIATFTGKTDGKSGICGTDEVFVTADAAFVDKKAETGKTVNITNLQLTGADAANYKIVAKKSQSTATADITVKKIIVSGIEANNKTYDGTTSATLKVDADNNIIATFTDKDGNPGGICGDDKVFVTADAAFVDKKAETGKTVNITNLQLTGADAANYKIVAKKSQSTATANINTKEVTVSGIKAEDRVYNGTRNIKLLCGDAVIDGKVAGDDLSVSATGKLKGKNANTNKIADINIITLYGDDAANYVLAATGNQTDIHGITVSPKTIKVVNGINAKNKVYDGNKTATFDCENALFDGVVSGDVVKVTAEGEFRNKNVGTRKVDITKIEIVDDTETDARNYVLAATGNQTLSQAKITRQDVVVTADNKTKVYSKKDPKLTATITGLVSGEEASDLISYEISREKGEDHGKYDINVTGDAKQGNYKVTFVDGVFTIKRIAYALELEYPNESPAVANKTDSPIAEFWIKDFDNYLSDTKFEYVVGDNHYDIIPDSIGRIYLPVTANGGTVQVKKDLNHKSSGGTVVYINEEEVEHTITSEVTYVDSNESNIIKCDYVEDEKLAYITVDGIDYEEKIDEVEYYKVSHGSTDVKLLNPIMNTLSVGNHSIRFHYNNGMIVDGSFYVAPKPTPKKHTYLAPKTGIDE